MMHHEAPPGTPMGTFQRSRAPFPPYYYTERSNYASPIDGHYEGTTVKVERYRPKCGPCMWILAILFTLFIIALVVCLIIFFTWGPAYASSGGGPTRAADRGGYVFDLEQPEFVLARLRKSDPNMCLLDTAFLTPNSAHLFAEEHIPTAQHFDIGKVLKKDENGQGFMNIFNFQNYVRSLGVDKGCHVVLYDHSESADSVTTATYAWYLFKLHRHDAVSVMNGGLSAWRQLTSKEKAFQATSDVKGKKDGDFEASWNSNLWVDFETLRNKLNRSDPPQLVDARKSEYYRGTSVNREAVAGGRMKGALNAPVDEIIFPPPNGGALKNLPDVKNWLSAKSLSPNKKTVVYADTGLQASALFFAMVQAGWDVKLYNNGWTEWSQKAPPELKETG